MKDSLLNKLTSFLLGTSWAFLLLGSVIIFQATLVFSFIFALLLTGTFFVMALFLILILEHLHRGRDRHNELEKKIDSLLHN